MVVAFGVGFTDPGAARVPRAGRRAHAADAAAAPGGTRVVGIFVRGRRDHSVGRPDLAAGALGADDACSTSWRSWSAGSSLRRRRKARSRPERRRGCVRHVGRARPTARRSSLATTSRSTASSSRRSTPSTTAATSWSRHRPGAARPSSPSTAIARRPGRRAAGVLHGADQGPVEPEVPRSGRRSTATTAVGLLTGDNAINGDAPIVVMTTEVLRNMIYAGRDARRPRRGRARRGALPAGHLSRAGVGGGDHPPPAARAAGLPVGDREQRRASWRSGSRPCAARPTS